MPVDLCSAEFLRDPHSRYAEMRARGPVHRASYNGRPVWLVVGYDAARRALADPRLARDPDSLGARERQRLRASARSSRTYGGYQLPPELTGNLSRSDAPEHTRLRRLVGRSYRPRIVSRMRPEIEAIVGSLLDGFADRSVVDIVADYALPLPLEVTCRLLGIPADDMSDFRAAAAVLLVNDQGHWQEAATVVIDILRRLMRAKRAEPAGDLLSALAATGHEDGDLTEGELTATAWLLITSGYATTANTIGNAVLALLTDPDRLAVLASAPHLIDRAVEELLRRDGGVNLAPVRVATEPVEIGDVTIEGGELVHIAIASANRDPAHFDDAERLDFERRQGDHLAFGHGMRYCLGAELARMETRIALARLLGRFPNLGLATDAASLQWQDTPVLRGVETLPVRLR